jgi:PAS domain-containing protein
LKQAASGPDGRETDWKKLLALIDAAYTEADDQHRLLEQARQDVAKAAQAATTKHRQIEQELRHNEAQLWVALEKLRDNEARYRDFTDAASDGYWELDSDLRYTYISPMPRVAGRGSLDDYLGKYRWDLVNPDEQDKGWHRHLDDLRKRRPFSDVRQFRKLPGGTPVSCMARRPISPS